MELVLREKVGNDEPKEVLCHKIRFTEADFYLNTVNKQKRLKKLASDILP